MDSTLDGTLGGGDWDGTSTSEDHAKVSIVEGGAKSDDTAHDADDEPLELDVEKTIGANQVVKVIKNCISLESLTSSDFEGKITIRVENSSSIWM